MLLVIFFGGKTNKVAKPLTNLSPNLGSFMSDFVGGTLLKQAKILWVMKLN